MHYETACDDLFRVRQPRQNRASCETTGPTLLSWELPKERYRPRGRLTQAGTSTVNRARRRGLCRRTQNHAAGEAAGANGVPNPCSRPRRTCFVDVKPESCTPAPQLGCREDTSRDNHATRAAGASQTVCDRSRRQLHSRYTQVVGSLLYWTMSGIMPGHRGRVALYRIILKRKGVASKAKSISSVQKNP